MPHSLVEPVVRVHPVDWLRIVAGALRSVGIVPPPAPLVNCLTTLNSYSAADAALYADPSCGLRDAQMHVALLRALDAAVGEWPAELRSGVFAPLPSSVPARRSQSRGGGVPRPSGPPLEGVRPLGEAVLVLYNAAVANVDAGVADLERVRADAARLEVLPEESAAAVAGGGAVRAPNVNAKSAYKRFIAARQLAAAALVLLEPTQDNAPLSVAESQYLRSLVRLDDLHALAAVCAATAKYVFSLFSASCAASPETLARLAAAASALPVPPSVASPTAHLLPTALLAACHRHAAEQHYQADPVTPNMASALGHVDLADRILRELERQCTAQGEGEGEVEGGATPPPRAPPSVLSSMWSRLRSLSASPTKRGNDADGSDADADADADAAPFAPNASFYTSLVAATADSDLARLLPVLPNLVRRVRELRLKLWKENDVVHFARPRPVAEVQADIPDPGDDAGEEAERQRREDDAALLALLPSPSRVVDFSAFDALPSRAELALRVTLHRQQAYEQQQVLEALERLSGVVAAVSALTVPAEAQLALEALHPCLEEHTGSISRAVAVATTAIMQAWQRHREAAAQWIAAQSALVGRAGGGDIAPPPLSASLEADVECWAAAAREAAALWTAAIGPFNESTTCSAEAVRAALFPEEAALQRFLHRCSAATDRVVAAMDDDSDGGPLSRKRPRLESGAAPPSTAEQLALLSGLEEEGEALWRGVGGRCGDEYWAPRTAAMRAAALVVWDAPQVASRVEEATARLVDEAVDAAVTAEAKARLAAVGSAAGDRSSAKKKKTVVLTGARPRDSSVASSSSSDGFHSAREASDDDSAAERENEEVGEEAPRAAPGGRRAAKKPQAKRAAAPKKKGPKVRVKAGRRGKKNKRR